MNWFKIKKRENRIPYTIWEVRDLILPKPHPPIKLIRKIHKLIENTPERLNFFIQIPVHLK